MRRSISQKTRFKVFERDGFACRYCYRTPPTVALQVDHVMPCSKGGGNDLGNLVTACWDCNIGKRDRTIMLVPPRFLGDALPISGQKIIEDIEFVSGIYEMERSEPDYEPDPVWEATTAILYSGRVDGFIFCGLPDTPRKPKCIYDWMDLWIETRSEILQDARAAIGEGDESDDLVLLRSLAKIVACLNRLPVDAPLLEAM